jgi:hypothetical protein
MRALISAYSVSLIKIIFHDCSPTAFSVGARIQSTIIGIQNIVPTIINPSITGSVQHHASFTQRGQLA